MKGEGGVRGGADRRARGPVAVVGMDESVSTGTRGDVLGRLRWRDRGAGGPHCKGLIEQAVEVLGYRWKSAIRVLAMGAPRSPTGQRAGRPARYDPGGPSHCGGPSHGPVRWRRCRRWRGCLRAWRRRLK